MKRLAEGKRPRRAVKSGNPVTDSRSLAAVVQYTLDPEEEKPLTRLAVADIAPTDWWTAQPSYARSALKSALWRVRFDRYYRHPDHCLIEIESNLYAPDRGEKEERLMTWLATWFLVPFGLTRQSDKRGGRGMVYQLWTGRLNLPVSVVQQLKALLTQPYDKLRKEQAMADRETAFSLAIEYGFYPVRS